MVPDFRGPSRTAYRTGGRGENQLVYTRLAADLDHAGCSLMASNSRARGRDSFVLESP